MRKSILLGLAGTFVFAANALAAESLTDWIPRQFKESKHRLLNNISPPGAARGTVAASLSRRDPDYYYHWIRDAALTMNTVFELYLRSSGTEAANLEQTLIDYVDLSRRNQTSPTPSDPYGLGEPKFNMDGTAFYGPWGRPQNDGPALRAVTLIRLAEKWLQSGKGWMVAQKLYRAEIPANTVIKADLEFVSHHWRMANFDLWEEVKGDHFYTRMVQRRALLDGARLARRLGDGAAADWYEQQGREIEQALRAHYRSDGNWVMATLNAEGGGKGKHSNLDSAVLLAALHGGRNDGFYDLSSDAILSTAVKLEDTFTRIYPINRNGLPGITVGRYPEDTYDGVGVAGEGNGWVLITNAFAEFYYSLARRYEREGDFVLTPSLKTMASVPYDGRVGQSVKTSSPLGRQIVRGLVAKGDAFLSRTKLHAYPDGGLSEQMNRHTGFMQGATDLTWSHASMLMAIWAR